MNALAGTIALLADPSRLRALRALRSAELTGGEVAEVIGVAPSTASKLLALLASGGFVETHREGRSALFRLSRAAAADPRWAAILASVAADDGEPGDRVRLNDILRRRREGPGGGAARTWISGRSWAAWARAVSVLAPRGLRAVDLGCGDGALSLEIARFARRVVAVDKNPAAVAAAEKRAARRGTTNVSFRCADFTAGRVPGGPFDLVFVSQVLHSVDDPASALISAARVAAPGGRVLVLDLLPHREEWVRETLGHRRLGFAQSELRSMMRAAGLREVTVEKVSGGTRDPFRVAFATGVRRGGRS